jgi:hypothetical protein
VGRLQTSSANKKRIEGGGLALDRKQIEFLVKVRDGAQMIADATNDYIDSLAPQSVKNDLPAVVEETFSTLKFEDQKGTKLGDYAVAYKQNNPMDKWTQAFDVLSKASATIQARYHGKSYQFSYWLYGEDKIYRQKRKEAAL